MSLHLSKTMSFGASSQVNWVSGESVPSSHCYSGSHSSDQGRGRLSQSEREELLECRIESIIVGLEALGPKAGHIATMVVAGFRAMLPWYMSPTLFYHASVCAIVYNKDYGVMLEYGRYENDREHDRPNEMHYWDKDGLRFSKIEISDYYDIIYGQNKTGSLLFPCNVDEHLSIRELIQAVHSRDDSWRGVDYHAELHNCQHFVAKVIKKLQAYRTDKLTTHTTDKTCIPHAILKELESNEENVLCKIEKLPVIGFVVGTVAQFSLVGKELIKKKRGE